MMRCGRTGPRPRCRTLLTPPPLSHPLNLQIMATAASTPAKPGDPVTSSLDAALASLKYASAVANATTVELSSTADVVRAVLWPVCLLALVFIGIALYLPDLQDIVCRVNMLRSGDFDASFFEHDTRELCADLVAAEIQRGRAAVKGGILDTVGASLWPALRREFGVVGDGVADGVRPTSANDANGADVDPLSSIGRVKSGGVGGGGVGGADVAAAKSNAAPKAAAAAAKAAVDAKAMFNANAAATDARAVAYLSDPVHQVEVEHAVRVARQRLAATTWSDTMGERSGDIVRNVTRALGRAHPQKLTGAVLLWHDPLTHDRSSAFVLKSIVDAGARVQVAANDEAVLDGAAQQQQYTAAVLHPRLTGTGAACPDLGLLDDLRAVGFDAPVVLDGRKLTPAQRQEVVKARKGAAGGAPYAVPATGDQLLVCVVDAILSRLEKKKEENEKKEKEKKEEEKEDA